MAHGSSPAVRLGLASCLAALCGGAVLCLAPPAGAATDVAAVQNAADDQDDLAKYGRLDERIRAAARRDGIPAPVAEALIRIFSDDVDLQRAAHPGDGFVIVTQTGDGGIVFASLTYGGQTKSFYRFATPGGAAGYFDQAGRSADKRLVRRPLDGGRLQAAFGLQRHPILGYAKMHTGVDWEAPLGTPIRTAGAGSVERAGWSGDYGEQVRLRHDGGYETAYAHLSKIADGLVPGARVEPGQVIGTVGSTGLSTSPHLHYEVLINGRFVDPLRIRLPAQRVLDRTERVDFDRRQPGVDADVRDAPFHPLVADK